MPIVLTLITRTIRLLKEKPESFWVKRGEERVLTLFHQMATRVPAYKNFLQQQGVRHQIVKHIADFQKVPSISKESYLKKYDIKDLCWDGVFSTKQWDISSTSGSTGIPYYFPRTDEQNQQYAFTAELYLRTNFAIHQRSTLYINCFALGVWIGGLFTYEALKIVASRGNYALTLINPGLNKNEILKVVERLGPQFDQIIIGGYPPFIKDVIDEGEQKGICWKNFRMGIVFSAEAFSEQFRDYIVAHAGLRNVLRDTLNHYGTVDLGTMAHETPYSILVRRLAVKHRPLYRQIFSEDPVRLPTLAQYNPEMFYFEAQNGGVMCSAWSGIPLVRYDLQDSGGIISFEKVKDILVQSKVAIEDGIQKYNIEDTIWRLPFVYVYERKDLCVSLAGANIYPETVKRALQDKRINSVVTGKFSLLVTNDTKQNQQLEVHIELKQNQKQPSTSFIAYITQLILDRLIKENSEFRSVFYDQKQGKAVPKIICWPYEDPTYFRVGGKQKWALK